MAQSPRKRRRKKKFEGALQAIVRVGAGRGFVVEINHVSHVERYVITAAHCLPKLPPCHAHSRLDERTSRNLLGHLGQKCTVWAECLFADPVSDVAVLCTPDSQELWKQAEGWDALVESAAALRIGDLAEQPEETTVWLPYLD